MSTLYTGAQSLITEYRTGLDQPICDVDNPVLHTGMPRRVKLKPMTQETLDEVDDISGRIEAIYSVCKAGLKPASQVDMIYFRIFLHSRNSTAQKHSDDVSDYGKWEDGEQGRHPGEHYA